VSTCITYRPTRTRKSLGTRFPGCKTGSRTETRVFRMARRHPAWPVDTSRRIHKIPIFSDAITSAVYLDMLVPTIAGDKWSVARYASQCVMHTN
jgi:hypothetical protein